MTHLFYNSTSTLAQGIFFLHTRGRNGFDPFQMNHHQMPMTVFDIPADRLTNLSDADLRELVARLCEAEREMKGGHRTEVRWGGAQTAADGGIDVMVLVQNDFEPSPILPRKVVGIQVKKSDLSGSKIETEMCPDGILRESIQEIARQAGAYLIVSVGVDCSKKMLEDRQRAMRQAVGANPNASALHSDFIDRHALARWVGAHPSVSLWLRERLGLPTLKGWVGYSRWSSTPEGIDDALICDDGLKFRLPGSEPIGAVPQALQAIRTLVKESRKAIRIAGLSGIGKTRIAQALFEQVDSGVPLPRSWAVYTDVGRDPEPLPLLMLETLISANSPAVMVVDNCPPDSHRVLAERLAKCASKVKLITIEYDVRDDRPEETEVVRIEAEGPEIVEALIRRRYTKRSSEDSRRLADLSVGNARLALALAAAAPQTGSLTSFDDDALFRRLFWQREQPDPEFERSAEALSLVYSFDAEGPDALNELEFISDLSGVSRLMLHRHATTLVARGLTQVRGRWRAVLPHALANRLAHRAIRSMPWRDLATAFGRTDAKRLRLSFGRRLAYLHDLREARQIVLVWMQLGGPLDATRGAVAYDLDLLERVCHLVPTEALDHLQQLAKLSFTEGHFLRGIDQFTRLLALLAHSPDHFDKAVQTLTDLGAALEDRHAANADRSIESLFGLYLSGTLARTPQRVETARRALFAQDPKVAKRGLVMLRAGMKTSMWSSSFLSTGDARPDAFGWHPRGPEVVEWFREWMVLGAAATTGTNGETGTKARQILAKGIVNLWRCVPPLRGEIEAIAEQLSRKDPWVEGWNALRRMRSLEMRRAAGLHELDLERLSALISALEPMELVDRTRAVLRSEGYFGEEEEGDNPRDFATARQRHATKLREIGEELAERPDVIHDLGAELFVALRSNPFELGRGLGSASVDPLALWQVLRDLYLAAPEPSRRPTILSGFLTGLDHRQADVADQIRGECLGTAPLKQTYASFAPIGQISDVEFSRLIEAASNPDIWAGQFSGFVWSDQHGLNDDQRFRLLSAMLRGKEGKEAAIDALAMLRHCEDPSPRDWPQTLRGIGINTVVSVITCEDVRQSDNLDYHAAEVLQKCLLPGDEVGARRLVDAVVEYAALRHGSLHGLERTAAELAERAPMIFLDRALSSADPRFRLGRDATFDLPPLANVEPEALIEWCQMGGPERWISVAEAIQPFGASDGISGGTETMVLSAQAQQLLRAAPDPGSVIAVFGEHLTATGFTSNRTTIMEGRLAAMEQLSSHSSEKVRQAFERQAPDLRHNIARERERERDQSRSRDVSFE